MELMVTKLICEQWQAFQWILGRQTSAQISQSKMAFDFLDSVSIQPPKNQTQIEQKISLQIMIREAKNCEKNKHQEKGKL